MENVGNSEGVIHHYPQRVPKLFFIFKRDSFIIPLRGMKGKNLHLLVAPVCAGGFLKKRVSLGIKDLDSYPQPVQAL